MYGQAVADLAPRILLRTLVNDLVLTQEGAPGTHKTRVVNG